MRWQVLTNHVNFPPSKRRRFSKTVRLVSVKILANFLFKILYGYVTFVQNVFVLTNSINSNFLKEFLTFYDPFILLPRQHWFYLTGEVQLTVNFSLFRPNKCTNIFSNWWLEFTIFPDLSSSKFIIEKWLPTMPLRWPFGVVENEHFEWAKSLLPNDHAKIQK